MPSTHESARALARRLIELEESRPRSTPTAESAPLEACYRLHRVLASWVGGIGCSALETRALRSAESGHPALQEMSVDTGTRPFFRNVPEAIAMYGVRSVATALEAYLEALLDLLIRFIGEDVVASLAERTADPESGDSTEPSDPT